VPDSVHATLKARFSTSMCFQACIASTGWMADLLVIFMG
jgi:hypothetical protein